MTMPLEILIVDDDPRMTESIAAILNSAGYQTRTTNSPQTAVELIVSDAFGIVLIDIMMPGMTGFDVMDRINGNRDTSEFIIITGDQSPDVAIKAIRKGAFDFIRKPYEPDELLKRVENAVTQLRLKEERRKAVDALNRLNEELEDAIAQRTAELMATNKRLNLEIQEKRLIEKNLRSSESKYSNLVSNSPDIIYMLDSEGRFSFVGGAVEKLLHYAPEELIGRHYSSLFRRPDDPGIKWRINERRTGERATRGHEVKLKPKAGAWPLESDAADIFELYASGIYDKPIDTGDTNFVGTYGVARDITERKKALKALRQSEERFRELAELLPEMLIEMDRHGRLTFFNKKTVISTGHSAKALAGDFSLSDLISAEDRARFEKACLAAIENTDISDQEFLVRRADGICFPVIMRTTPISDNGTTGGIRALLIDITEIKKTREMLQATKEKAEIASRAKSEFLANMSHEIRTPLNGIIGVCDLMVNTPMDQKQREYTSIIQSSGKSLLGLINDILDFSKIEAGKLAFEQIAFQPGGVIDEVADLFLDRLLKKNIKLTVDVGSAVPNRVIGDPLRLRQVLTNLMSNAVKFTERGEIHITVGVDSEYADGIQLRFEVRDTGIGIAPDVQESIFDAFTQADGTTTRKYGGTGLGLAISRRIVEMMGGRIRLRSEPEKGSSFYFTAGFSKAVVERHRPHRISSSFQSQPFDAVTEICCSQDPIGPLEPDGSAETGDFPGARVLLVEDNPINRRVAEEILKLAGIEVVTAQNGKEALDKMAGGSIDAVLMDIQMPELDGLAATRAIRNEMNNGDIPIIAMTAHAMQGDRERCLEAGMNDYVSKPIDRKELFSTLRRHIGRKRVGPSEDTPLQNQSEISLPGLDITEGMNRLGADLELYMGIIAEYCANYRDVEAVICDAVEAGNYKKAEQTAHSLKGASGNISATDLYQYAIQLERLCRARSDDHILDLSKKIAAELRRLSTIPQKIQKGCFTTEDPR